MQNIGKILYSTDGTVENSRLLNLQVIKYEIVRIMNKGKALYSKNIFVMI